MHSPLFHINIPIEYNSSRSDRHQIWITTRSSGVAVVNIVYIVCRSSRILDYFAVTFVRRLLSSSVASLCIQPGDVSVRIFHLFLLVQLVLISAFGVFRTSMFIHTCMPFCSFAERSAAQIPSCSLSLSPSQLTQLEVTCRQSNVAVCGRSISLQWVTFISRADSSFSSSLFGFEIPSLFVETLTCRISYGYNQPKLDCFSVCAFIRSSQSGSFISFAQFQQSGNKVSVFCDYKKKSFAITTHESN